MGEHEIITNELEKISTTIRDEKSSEYPKSKYLANKLYARIMANMERDLYREFSLESLKKLIEISIVIHNYPKRIIRKGTKTQSGIQFDSSIICLLNPSIITFSDVNITQYMVNPQNEIQISLSGKVEFQNNHWNIKNMKYQPGTTSRSSRNSTCEKCKILFKFQGLCNNKHIQIITKELFSDTVITICHSHQEIDCLITLFWDDYYRRDVSFQPEPLNFDCIEHSTFKKLIEHFSDYCLKETKRSLTENNKNYLFNMLFDLFPLSDHIKFDDFMKKPMQKSKLSFGKWLMSIIKMLKIPTLMPLWENGFIEGFISKDVENILTNPGSFLLRFSERKAAIGVVLRSFSNQIDPWDPYTDSQLRSSNLSNLLDDFSTLLHIRKANGDLLECRTALTEFKDEVPIDDGYTRRGYVDNLNFQVMDFSESDTIGESPVDLNGIEQEALALLEDDYEVDES